jgi:hypothetical protein
MVGIGFDPCKSNFTLTPPVQFTSKPIKITVNINERNGHPITSNLSLPVSTDIAARIKSHSTFGEVTGFNYDGYQIFTADITSKTPGKGKLMISFDDNIFCTNTFPENIDTPATHTLQSLDYQFVYSPAGVISPSVFSSEGDTTGQPRRDEGDMSRDSDNKGSF